MGARYLIDTNVAIGYLDSILPERGLEFMDNVPAIILSVVTRIELLSWRNATKSQLTVLESYISDAKVFDLSEAVIRKTIAIRKEHGLKLPDAIIAATSLVHDLTLLTRNTSDFNRITGLEVINPWEI